MICIGAMPVALSLSSDPVRQLTSREIALILCSTLSGIMRMDPHDPHDLPDLLSQAGRAATAEYLLAGGSSTPAWTAAYLVTASSFYEWCERDVVDTALEWMRQVIRHPQDVGSALTLVGSHAAS